MSTKAELELKIASLSNEIENLHAIVTMKQERIKELIGENDRLTMRYEPWRPEDDEDHGLDFYTLVEDNKVLSEDIGYLSSEVARLEDLSERLDQDRLNYYDLVKMYMERIHHLEAEIRAPKTKKKRQYTASLSFDFWPISDWFRLKIYRWNPGKSFQLYIGPIRFDFQEV